MSAKSMGKNIINSINQGFTNFTPRPRFELVRVGKRESTLIPHKLTNY